MNKTPPSTYLEQLKKALKREPKVYKRFKPFYEKETKPKKKYPRKKV